MITYTRGAAGELRGRIRARAARARPPRPRARARRRLDLDDPRLLRAAAEGASVRGRARPALPRARRAARARAPRRGVRRARSPRSAPAASPSGCGCSRPTAPRGLRRMLTGVYETLRSAGRPLVLELGERADLGERLAELREAARCLADDAGATDGAARDAARRAGARPAPRPPSGCSTSARCARRGERAATLRGGAQGGRAGGARRAGAAATASCSRSCSTASPPRTRRRRSASRRSTSRTSSCSRATCSRDDERVREREQLRFRAIMVDEFQDTNALQCELVDLLAGPGERRSSSSATSSSRSTASGTPTSQVFRERRAAAAQRLPLTRNYRSRPEVLAAVNHLFGAEFGDELPAARGLRRVPRPGLRPPGRAARHRQGVVRRQRRRTGAAARRGTSRGACASSSTTGAATPGEIVLLFAAGTDAEWYEEELRARRPADLPRDRPRLLRPAAGRRPARVPAPAAQPLRRRGARDACSRRRSSASRTTRSC